MGTGKFNSYRLDGSFCGPGVVAQATELAQRFSAGCELDAGDTARLVIIVEELVTNVYEHGAMPPDAMLDIDLACEPGHVSMVLIDSGTAFDPRGADDGAMPERGGGAGLNLVRSWTEIVDYSSAHGRNRLELRMALRRKG